MATFEFEKSDRLKELSSDIAGYADDLEDVHHLLRMMVELVNQDGDLSEETIARALALWRSAWPELERIHDELGSINLEIREWK